MSLEIHPIIELVIPHILSLLPQ